MRVLYFHQHFATRGGSNGSRSYELARLLTERGHQVTMVCGAVAGNGLTLPWDARRRFRRGMVSGVDVIELPLPYSNRDSFAKRVRTFVSYAARTTWLAMQLEYDLVFATSTPLTAGIPGIAARIVRRKPFVFEVRDLWPDLPHAMGAIRNPLILGAMSVLERVTYRVADAAIGLAPGIVRGIIERSRSGLPVAMVPNSCDLGYFSPELRTDAARLPGVGPDDTLAVFAGTHGLAQRLESLLEAAAELRRSGRDDIKIAFIGDGRSKDGLVARARHEGLTNCLFLDPIPKEKLASVLASADIGLMILANIPAFYEGTSPNKFFDYIASGLPVIINYPGWVARLIEDNSCGIAVRPDDPAALAGAIIRLADSADSRRVMGAASRQLAERSFDRQNLGAEWISVLEQAHQRAGAR